MIKSRAGQILERELSPSYLANIVYFNELSVESRPKIF